jgi:hypothetical protein
LGYLFGGGNKGSRANLKLFYSMLGITLFKTLEVTYKHGLVFI